MNKNNFLKSPVAKYIGVGLAGALIAGGITFGVMNNANDKSQSVSESGAKATSLDIWQSLSTDLPVGWNSKPTSMETEKLKFYQSERYASNDQSTCSFSLGQSTMETPEFKGTDIDYLTKQRVLSYGEHREAQDASLQVINVKTSAGEVPFYATSFNVKQDANGDGKKETTREIRLAHAFPEITKDKTIPVIDISYSCNNVEEWSEPQFKALLEASTINISGDPAPEIPVPEETNPDEGKTLDAIVK